MIRLKVKQLITNGFKFPTVLSQIYNFFLLVIGIYVLLLFGDYGDPSPTPAPEDPKVTFFIVAFEPFLFECLPALLKVILFFWDKKYKTEPLKRYKRDLIIGFGGILFSGTIQLLVLYIIGNDLLVISLSFILFNITSIIFLIIFIYEPTCFSRYSKPIKDHKIILWCTLSLHVILLIIPPLILRFTEHDSIFLGVAIVYHIYYFSIYAVTTIELLVVCKGDIVLIGNGAPENAINCEKLDQSIECKICLLEYNDTSRIPRILKECGHTICEGCAKELLKINNGQQLFCPFCQTVTVVKGPANLLVKNFLALDMIDEKKTENNDLVADV